MARVESGEVDIKTVFLICPVRDIPPEEEALIGEYVEGLRAMGVNVYWPLTDTAQEGDPVGLRILGDNLAAMTKSDEVYVWFSPTSKGSLFDLGMAFALGKRVRLAKPEMVEPTEGKSFNNVLLALDKMDDR